MNGAAVHHRHVANQHVVADDERATLVIARTRWVAMKDGAVLHIGALTNADFEDISANNTIVPDRGACPNLDIADDRASRRDEGGFVNLGRLPMDRDDIDAWIVAHCACSHCALVREYWISGSSSPPEEGSTKSRSSRLSIPSFSISFQLPVFFELVSATT